MRDGIGKANDAQSRGGRSGDLVGGTNKHAPSDRACFRCRLKPVTRGGDDPDAALVAAAAQGDRDAFATLLERHYKRIHGLAWQLTGTRADADDIAQDVCCLLIEKIGSFRGEARFTTWLYGIVYNACHDLRRRRRSLLGLAERLALLVRASDDRDLHDALWLKSAIARLKPAYRDTVVLVAGQQLTHAEAAAILGVAEATVSWRMHEVRRLLAPERAAD